MIQKWFGDDKFGIFLHWGIYSAGGISESWPFFVKNGMAYEEYMELKNSFSAENYDPGKWAEQFKKWGARYAVLTAKHHDGFALWDTKVSDLNTLKDSAAKRDLIATYCKAMQEAGLKTGIYFSHLDWSHPDYCSVPVGERTEETVKTLTSQSWPGGAEDPQWQRFLKFHREQLKELCTRYGKIDLLWFDGDWAPSSNNFWKFDELRKELHGWQPEVILNSRMYDHGDYETPELALPVSRPDGPWEFCIPLAGSWTWSEKSDSIIPFNKLIRMFGDCIGNGGNFLLGIGPDGKGEFHPKVVETMDRLGAWIKTNSEAIYETEAGLPSYCYSGNSTYSKDKKSIYLFAYDNPRELSVKGVCNTIRNVSVLGSGKQCKWNSFGGTSWTGVPGLLWIDIPEEDSDPACTVIKIDLVGELKLYTGTGAAIDYNEGSQGFSKDSLLSNLMADERSRRILEKYLGDMIYSEDAQAGMGFSLALIQLEISDIFPMEALEAMDQELRDIK